MLTRPRAMSLGPCLLASALAACFNPTGATTDATATGGASTGGPEGPTTGATLESATGPPTTSTTDPITSTDATTGTTTGEPCGQCPLETPLCLETSCVQCIGDADCGSVASYCDTTTHTCRECLVHQHCDTACALATGECFPESALTFNVVPADTCGGCGNGIDCCSIDQALGIAAASSAPYVLIRLIAGSTDVVPVTLKGNDFSGRHIAIVGSDENAELQAPSGASITVDQLAVAEPANLYLWRLRLPGTMTSTGVHCLGAPVWIDETEIRGHQSQWMGVHAENCRATIRRSFILENFGGILSVGDDLLVLRDTVVGGSKTGPELQIGANTTIDARYVTVADSAGALLACLAPKLVRFENSIVIGSGAMGEVTSCEGFLSVSHSVVNSGPLAMENNNVVVAYDQLGFDSRFLLTALDSPPKDVAVWRTGDSPVDIDGDARPALDGSPDYAGADVPTP